MSELHHSLETMGVVQYLFAVTFLACYALAIGGFLGPGARGKVALVGIGSGVGFSGFTDPWVHGVLLTAFAVFGIGVFLGVAWLLKALFASAVGEVSPEAAFDDAVAAAEAADPAVAATPARAGLPGAATPAGDAGIGRLLGAETPSLDRHAS